MLSSTRIPTRRKQFYDILIIITLFTFVTTGLHLSRNSAYSAVRFTKITAEELEVLRKDQKCKGACVDRFEDPFNLTTPRLLRGVKNPCWREPLSEAVAYYRAKCNRVYSKDIQMAAWTKAERDVASGKTSRLRCLPYAYLIGMPKCGTTDLFYRLLEHSDVLPGMKKESHWPAKGAFGSFFKEPERCIPFSWFLDNFDNAARQIEKEPQTKISIDASASTMWFQNGDDYHLRAHRKSPHPPSAHVLKRISPGAKFIVSFRNPVERLYSDFSYFKLSEDLTPQNFHNLVVDSVRLYTECFRTNSTSSCIYDAGLTGQSAVRTKVGFYDTYLEDWWSVFPRENFHVVIMERYAQDQASHVDDIFAFLGLEPLWKRKSHFHPMAGRYNSHKSDEKKEDMLPETKKLLYDFYKPSVEHLASLLDDNSLLSLWRFS